MRYFNTSGPCYPTEHYTVIREDLLATGQKLVEQGRYFTIFAPRQAGKTTYFQLLLQKLAAEKRYTPIWISFENLKTLARTKIFTDDYYFQKGKRQLAAYLASENLAEGYYVVFSNKHADADELYLEEEIDGKRIYTYLIRTDVEPASQAAP